MQNTSVGELRQRLQKFNKTWNDFNAAQAAIEELEDGTEQERNHEEKRNTFEEKYFQIASEFETLIEHKSEAQMPNVHHVPQNLREDALAIHGSAGSNNHLKLPRVNLPTFAGTFEKWIPFRNTSKYD